jgi:hypothetical protein
LVTASTDRGGLCSSMSLAGAGVDGLSLIGNDFVASYFSALRPGREMRGGAGWPA